MCGENSCNVFVLVFVVVLWVHVFAILCMMVVPILWHASMFLELRHVGCFLHLFPFLIGGFLAPAGGAAAAAPEGGALARPSAPTSTFTRWALVAL
jgi:hypothetical protein